MFAYDAELQNTKHTRLLDHNKEKGIKLYYDPVPFPWKFMRLKHNWLFCLLVVLGMKKRLYKKGEYIVTNDRYFARYDLYQRALLAFESWVGITNPYHIPAFVKKVSG